MVRISHPEAADSRNMSRLEGTYHHPYGWLRPSKVYVCIFAIERNGEVGRRNLPWVEDNEFDFKLVKSLYSTNK